MLATSTSGIAASAPRRHIQPSASTPSAIPTSEYAVSPSFDPVDAVVASHSPTTCAQSLATSAASPTPSATRQTRVRLRSTNAPAIASETATNGHGDGGGTYGTSPDPRS